MPQPDPSIPEEVINVLHVDDKQGPLELAKAFIELSDRKIHLESVTTPEASLKRLEEDSFDCVVCDYQMPGLDGVSLARIIRESSDIPIILYTGKGSEEVAEAAFNVGVNDYIRKETTPSHYQVLGRRIRAAVEKHRAENALKNNEGKYRSLVHNSRDAIMVFTGTKLSFANTQAATLHGFESVDAFMRVSPSTILHPDDRVLIEERSLARQRGEDVPPLSEFRLVLPDGSERQVQSASSLIQYDGKPATLAFLRDITEQKILAEESRKSEERYRDIFEMSPDVIMTGDMKGFITSANPAFTRATGYPVESIIGKHFSKTGKLIAREMPKYLMIFRSIVRGKKIPPFEFPFKHKDGTIRWAEAHIRFQEVDGKKVGIQGVIRDITERKHFTSRVEALHTHAVELASAEDMDSIADVTIRAVESVFGYHWIDFNIVQDEVIVPLLVSDDELRSNMMLPLDGPGIVVRAYKTGVSQRVDDVRRDDDYVIGRGSESEMWLSELAVPVKIDGETVAIINIEDKKLSAFTDNDQTLVEIFAEHVASSITQLRHVERLLTSEEKYRNLIESSTDAIFVLDEEKYLYVNRRASELLGYESAEMLIGQDAFQHVAPEYREMVRERAISRQRGKGQPGKYEISLVRRDGSRVPVEVSVTGIMFEGKQVSLAINRDLSELKKTEETLLALNQHARVLADCHSLDEVYDHTIQVMTETLKFPRVDILMVDGDVLSQVTASGSLPLGVQIPLDGKGLTVKAIREKTSIIVNDVSQSEDYIYASGGSTGEPFAGYPLSQSELVSPIVVDGEAVGVLNVEGTRTDAFTEQNKMFLELLAMHVASAVDRIRRFEELESLVEEKTGALVDAERMVTAGRISSMVGHDLRGPLQSIKNSLFILKRDPGKQDEMLNLIDSSVDYAAVMLDELRMRTQDDRPQKQTTDLSDMLRRAIAEAPLTDKIDVDLSLGDGLDSIVVDSTQIRRVIDNLIRNAVEAMPNGGTLKVSGGQNGDEAVLTIKDTGVGIPEDKIRDIFRPFYTTKSRGLGLGLAYCKRAIEAHGGTISLESEVGRGTTFTVRLPIKPKQGA